jgi:hypothetical protein
MVLRAGRQVAPPWLIRAVSSRFRDEVPASTVMQPGIAAQLELAVFA